MAALFDLNKIESNIFVQLLILNILQVFICKLYLIKAEKEKRNVLQKLCSILKGRLLQWTDQL